LNANKSLVGWNKVAILIKQFSNKGKSLCKTIDIHCLVYINMEIILLSILSDKSCNSKFVCPFSSNVCVMVSFIWFSWFCIVSIKSIGSIEELANISTNVVIKKELSTWMMVSKFTNIKDHIIKQHQFFAVSYSLLISSFIDLFFEFWSDIWVFRHSVESVDSFK